MKKLLVLFLLSPSIMLANLANELHRDPWEFVRDEFITIPNLKASDSTKILLKSLIAGSVGFGSYRIMKEFHSSYYEYGEFLDFEEAIENTKFGGLAYYSIIPSSILIAYLMYYETHMSILSKLEREQCINFIKAWPNYKYKSPKELQAAFDKFYDAYRSNPQDVLVEISEIIRLTKNQINNHFGVPNKSRFLDTKIFTNNIIMDLARTLGSTLKVVKYFKKK